MRFNHLKGTLPHPVLRSEDSLSDYKEGSIEFSMELLSQSVRISSSINQPDLMELVHNNKASIALAIHCEKTYYYEVINLPKGNSVHTLNFKEAELMGAVYCSLIVKAVEGIDCFQPKGLDDTFLGLSFNIRKGDVLAISDEERFDYSLPRVKLGESIFELEKGMEMPTKEFAVDPDNPKIKVLAGEELNDLIQHNMTTTRGRLANISTVYFPALVEILYRIQAESFQHTAWYEALDSAAGNVGVDDLADGTSWEPLQLAEKLLKEPYIKSLELEVQG